MTRTPIDNIFPGSAEDAETDGPLSRLLESLALERVAEDRFRGWSYDIGSGTIFGGHLLAQALMAGCDTVDSGLPHSLHAYFLRPGALDAALEYRVERIRNGRRFCTRQVSAEQRGKTVFCMWISFHAGEAGPEHAAQMPAVPGPEGLHSLLDLRRASADRFPERIRHDLLRERPVEIRPVAPVDPLYPGQYPPVQHVWLRSAGTLPERDVLHLAMLAYASDFSLLATAFLPHGITYHQPGIHTASLDHSLWFHRPFRADRWLLYSMDSPSSHGGRALARGTIFTRDGSLVASTAQEGLIRVVPSEGGHRLGE